MYHGRANAIRPYERDYDALTPLYFGEIPLFRFQKNLEMKYKKRGIDEKVCLK